MQERNIGVRNAIMSDIAHLEGSIEDYKAGRVKIRVDGRLLKGAERAAEVRKCIQSLEKDIKSLTVLLSSAVFPKVYHSLVANKPYHRSLDEMPDVRSSSSENYAFCMKRQRDKSRSDSQSRFFLQRLDHSAVSEFVPERRTDYPRGACSLKVKKCFIEGQSEPRYAMKVFDPKAFRGHAIYELRVAMRGAYAASLLGGTGIAFRSNYKQYLLSDWLDGQTLNSLFNTDQSAILNISINKRIRMAFGLLREIYILHANGLIHSDINPNNIMLVKGSLLKLIDLDSVRLSSEKSKPGRFFIGCTEAFMHDQMCYDVKYLRHSNNVDERSNIYALGKTLAYLFPEVVRPEVRRTTVNVFGGCLTSFEREKVVLLRGDQYNTYSSLGEFIVSLTKAGTRLCTMPLVIKELNKVYCQMTGAYYDMQAVQGDPAVGKRAFKGIERALNEYDRQVEIWAGLFSKPKPKSEESASAPTPASATLTFIKNIWGGLFSKPNSSGGASALSPPSATSNR